MDVWRPSVGCPLALIDVANSSRVPLNRKQWTHDCPFLSIVSVCQRTTIKKKEIIAAETAPLKIWQYYCPGVCADSDSGRVPRVLRSAKHGTFCIFAQIIMHTMRTQAQELEQETSLGSGPVVCPALTRERGEVEH